MEELKLSDEQVMMLIVRFMALTLRITPEQGARCFKKLVAETIVEGQDGLQDEGGNIIA